MSRPSGAVVVAGGALLASPALYAGLVAGTLPIGATLLRFTVAVVVVWLGVVSLLALLDTTSPAPARLPAETDQPDSTPRGA